MAFRWESKDKLISLQETDCVTAMKKLADKSVDLIVTSPPYNLGKEYGAYKDNLPKKDYYSWTREWATQAGRILSDKGSLFLNVGSKPSDPWLASQILEQVLEGSFLELQNTIHWIKAISIGDEKSYGHYKPINSERFLNDCHEYVFHLTRRSDVTLDRKAIGVPYMDVSNTSRWKGADGVRCRGNTWFIPYETIQLRSKDRPHPATFPVRLAWNCLKLHGEDRINLALDPFVGLGSSAVAAAQLGVRFIGYDLDKDYLHYAQQRVEGALP
jgi:site-specific DNA-methyltransferase (adenine-specific)